MTSVTIVGTGIAGVRTAQRLRRRGFDGSLVCIEAERYDPYNRPPLSKAALAGDPDLPRILAPTAQDSLGLTIIKGEPATDLDTSGKVLHVGGRAMAYDHLVIATGSRARTIPELPGITLRTWDDAQALRERMRTAQSMIVVGAGLIGCEVAATARRLGLDVTVIDTQAQPMSRVLGDHIGGVLATLHQIHGVRLLLDESVGAQGDALVLSDGSILQPDVILQAVGSSPECAWLASSGIASAHGVVCDQSGRTSAADVYAVGDVAIWNGVRSEHWTAATAQADCVSATITGQEPPEAEAPYWWSDQYGLKIQGVGSCHDADEVVMAQSAGGRLVAICLRGGDLAGAVGFSAPREVMQVGQWLVRGESVSLVWDSMSPLRDSSWQDVLERTSAVLAVATGGT